VFFASARVGIAEQLENMGWTLRDDGKRTWLGSK
jgi:hypothetical protein